MEGRGTDHKFSFKCNFEVTGKTRCFLQTFRSLECPEGKVQYQTNQGHAEEGLETSPAGTELCTPKRQVKVLTPIHVILFGNRVCAAIIKLRSC